MSQNTPLRAEPSQRKGGTATLRKLREAVADDYIGKLPSSLSSIEFARLARLTHNELLALISRGTVVARGGGSRPVIFPSDNRDFLMQPAVFALSARNVPVVSATQPAVIKVSAHAFERLSQRASDAGLDHATVVDRILAYADTALLVDASGARTAGYLVK